MLGEFAPLFPFYRLGLVSPEDLVQVDARNFEGCHADSLVLRRVGMKVTTARETLKKCGIVVA